MSSAREAGWREVRDLFDEVVDLGPARRAERLAAAGVIDPALRRAVELLLAGDAEVDARLARLEAALGFDGANASARTTRPIDPLGLNVDRVLAHLAESASSGLDGHERRHAVRPRDLS